jgi:hypothetical protein
MAGGRTLYLIIGALLAVVGVLGYQLYEARKGTTGVQLSIGERGISLETR